MQPSISCESNYRVVVFNKQSELDELTDLFVKTLGSTAIDARVGAKHVPGVLPFHLSCDKAQELAQAVCRLGVHAEAIPQQFIPHLDDAQTVHHVRCTPAGLEVLGLQEETQTLVHWGDVELLGIGQLPLETTVHFDLNAPRFSAARHTAHQPLRTLLPDGPEAWIIGRNPGRAFRIDHARMNYETLGAQKTDSATANFRLFVETMVAHVPEAYLTPSTRSYLCGAPAYEYAFESSECLQRYVEFHLLIRQRLEQLGNVPVPCCNKGGAIPELSTARLFATPDVDGILRCPSCCGIVTPDYDLLSSTLFVAEAASEIAATVESSPTQADERLPLISPRDSP